MIYGIAKSKCRRLMKNAHLNENSSDGYRGLCIFIYFAWESNPFALLTNSAVTTQLQEHRQDLCDFKHGMVARQLVWVFPKLPTYWDFHAQPSKRIVRDRRNIQRVSILWVEMSCLWQRSEENDQTGLKATRCKPIWPSEHILCLVEFQRNNLFIWDWYSPPNTDPSNTQHLTCDVFIQQKSRQQSQGPEELAVSSRRLWMI